MPRLILQILILIALALTLIAHGTAAATIAEREEQIIAGRPLILYGAAETGQEAQAVQASYRLEEQIDIPTIPAIEASQEQRAGHDILAFGTPETNTFIAQCLERLPIRLTDQAVTIGDSVYAGSDIRLVAALPNPLNPERECIIYTAQDESLIPGIFFGVGASHGEGDFLAYRKSDGVYYQEDRLALGSFIRTPKGLELGETHYWSKPPRALRRITEGHVAIHYDSLSPAEARSLARYVNTLRTIADEEYGIPMPPRLDLYIYYAPTPETRISIFTDAWNTFWVKMRTPKEEFLAKPMVPVAFAHEVARIVFQPVNSDPEKRGPNRYYNDDWSHYFQYTVLVPEVYRRLGDEGWPVPNDYHALWGAERFANLYQGADDTYASLMRRIDREFGREVISATVNRETAHGVRRLIEIEGFMRTLGEATGDPEMMRLVAAAVPTSLESSLNRRIEPLGFHPRLEEMFDSHTFVIDSVTVGSPADTLGLRAGDRIVSLNGFEMENAKGQAHRSILAAYQNDGWVEVEALRGEA
ncbi:MAG: PDZ domain-containing protein, partial [Candidatus Eisenbacteria bacterium]|nr:PDZ domain-containing protein [Candidatus Eisenbacteria bacterium]